MIATAYKHSTSMDLELPATKLYINMNTPQGGSFPVVAARASSNHGGHASPKPADLKIGKIIRSKQAASLYHAGLKRVNKHDGSVKTVSTIARAGDDDDDNQGDNPRDPGR